VSVGVWKVAAPIIGSVLRPVLKEAIKGGLVLGREIQTMAEEVWQDMEDLAAEAQEELDQNQKEKPAAKRKPRV
jgi:hypothetical protein